MTPETHDDFLEGFFAAARAEEALPRTALLSAILADAADVQAARTPAPASVPVPAPRPARWRIGRLFTPLGGVAALGACVALGFWLGIAGSLTIDGTTLSAGTGSETAAYGPDAFFDYASLEE